MQCVLNSLKQILGLSTAAKPQAIKRAYRKLALKLHPDKLGAEATEEQHNRFIEVSQQQSIWRLVYVLNFLPFGMTQIARAYEILSDPERKEKYDNYGEEVSCSAWRQFIRFETHFGLLQGGSQSMARVYSGSHFNLFVRVPGAAFQFNYKPPAMPKVPPIVIDIPVELREIYSGNGTTKTISVKKNKFCPRCKGTGAASQQDIHTCEVCSGSGLHSTLYAHASGYSHVVQTPCKQCERTGYTVHNTCPLCNGM